MSPSGNPIVATDRGRCDRKLADTSLSTFGEILTYPDPPSRELKHLPGDFCSSLGVVQLA